VKILFVRFSSIGDIVLTSPVIRATWKQYPDAEIHYLTKSKFATLVAPNPHISKVHTIENSLSEVLESLQSEQFDWVIDLHNNLRTRALKLKLRRPSKTFRKLNKEKWMLVNFGRNRMPDLHVVDRYAEALQHLGVQLDGAPCDFYIESKHDVKLEEWRLTAYKYTAVAIGAQHATKRLPAHKLIELIELIDGDVVLLGGPEDKAVAHNIVDGLNKTVVNTVGRLTIQQSASIAKRARHVVTHDTGMMHIASCFGVPLSTIWGNTVPAFGMYPYQPVQKSYTIHEVSNLNCRPCSKIGSEKCPKGHFKCMEQQDMNKILASITSESQN
jgi:ADP-heptose:LPS heptosyltransferase